MIDIIHSTTLHGSLRIPFVVQGDRAGMPLLLLHGYTDSWRSFDLLLPHLPRDLRVIAPTLRGHGDAARPVQGYTATDFASDAVALLDSLGFDHAVVVGHSMGGQVALRLALDFPRRVLGLVLMGGFATLRGNAVAEELWNESISTLQDPLDPAFVEQFQRSTVTRTVPDGFLRRMVQESQKLPARIWRAALRGQVEVDLTMDLGRIAAPTLLLHGDADKIAPQAMQRQLASAIPNAQRRMLMATGHAPHWEEPERVATEISRFVRGTVLRSRLAA